MMECLRCSVAACQLVSPTDNNSTNSSDFMDGNRF